MTPPVPPIAALRQMIAQRVPNGGPGGPGGPAGPGGPPPGMPGKPALTIAIHGPGNLSPAGQGNGQDAGSPGGAVACPNCGCQFDPATGDIVGDPQQYGGPKKDNGGDEGGGDEPAAKGDDAA